MNSSTTGSEAPTARSYQFEALLARPSTLTVTMAMLIRGRKEEVLLVLLLVLVLANVDKAVRAVGCTKLLLNEADGTTNARAYPAMQAIEMLVSFMLQWVLVRSLSCAKAATKAIQDRKVRGNAIDEPGKPGSQRASVYNRQKKSFPPTPCSDF